MDENQSVIKIDVDELFKEINQYVSSFELLEPLSPVSSDSESESSSRPTSPLPSTCSLPSCPSNIFELLLLGEKTETEKAKRIKNDANLDEDDNILQSFKCVRKAKHKSNQARKKTNEKLKDPLEDKLLNMVTKGKTNQNQASQINLRPGKRRKSKVFETIKEGPDSLSNDSGISSPGPDLQVALSSERCSIRIPSKFYFRGFHNGFSKYPSYFDFFDNIKKPFKEFDSIFAVADNGPAPLALTSTSNDFDYTNKPQSSQAELESDILTAINSLLTSYS